MGRRGLIRVVTGALLTSVVACTVHKQETPSLTGPSEFAKSITLSVNPDILSQDGQSQSVVSVDARDSNGQPLRSVSLRADVAVNGSLTTTLGSLSARSLVTDANGHASVVYTAPTLPAGSPVAAGVIQILVTPAESGLRQLHAASGRHSAGRAAWRWRAAAQLGARREVHRDPTDSV